MRLKRGASYLEDSHAYAVRAPKSKFGGFISALLALVAVSTTMLAAFFALPAESTSGKMTSAEALSIACRTVIGHGMEKRHDWGGGGLPKLPHMTNRTFTLNEIIQNPSWTMYTGIGDGYGWLTTPYSEILETIATEKQRVLDDGTWEHTQGNTQGLNTKYPTAFSDTAILSRMQSARVDSNCLWTNMLITQPANFLGLGLASGIQNLVGFIAVSVFDANIFCDPQRPIEERTGCLDITAVIGGTDDKAYQNDASQGGIIGMLTNSLYMPLVIIVVVLTAFGVAWTGLVKREFRKALGQFGWLILSFVIGLGLLLNPSLIAKAPMIATNTMTACVVGSFNGTNCFTGESTTESSGAISRASQAVCKAAGDGPMHEQTTLTVTSLNCSMWRAFVLENYTQGAFGASLSDLDLLGAGTVGDLAVEAAGLNPELFCFYLSNDKAASDIQKEWIRTNERGDKICNLAIYNILMGYKITPNVNKVSSEGILLDMEKHDPAWYNLVTAVAADHGLWGHWTSPFTKMASGFTAFFTVLAGSAIVLIASVAALMYYLAGIILLCFAPIFALVGLHPGRGKKIMLGWVEKVVSSFLKYFASAVFLLVALALYAGILGSTGPLWSAIFAFIITIVLMMYRKEIVEMFSKVDLGGEKMTSILDKDIPMMGASASALGKKAKQLPGAVIGGAVGGALAGGPDGRRKAMRDGARIAAANELRSTPGAVGRTAQAFARQGQENKADAEKEARRMKENANQEAKEAHEDNKTANDRTNDRKEAQAARDEAHEREDEARDAEATAEKEHDAADAEGQRILVEIAAFSKDDIEKHYEAIKATQASFAGAGAGAQNYAELQSIIAQMERIDIAIAQAEMRNDDTDVARLSQYRDSLVSNYNQLNKTLSSEERQAYNAVYEDELAKQLSARGVADADGQPIFDAAKYEDVILRQLANKLDIIEKKKTLSDAQRAHVNAKEASVAADQKLDITIQAEKQAQVNAVRSTSSAVGSRAEAAAMADLVEKYGPGRLPSERDIERDRKLAHAIKEKVESQMAELINATMGNNSGYVAKTSASETQKFIEGHEKNPNKDLTPQERGVMDEIVAALKSLNTQAESDTPNEKARAAAAIDALMAGVSAHDATGGMSTTKNLLEEVKSRWNSITPKQG